MNTSTRTHAVTIKTHEVAGGVKIIVIIKEIVQPWMTTWSLSPHPHADKRSGGGVLSQQTASKASITTVRFPRVSAGKVDIPGLDSDASATAVQI